MTVNHDIFLGCSAVFVTLFVVTSTLSFIRCFAAMRRLLFSCCCPRRVCFGHAGFARNPSILQVCDVKLK
jgi:hypothetical protein